MVWALRLRRGNCLRLGGLMKELCIKRGVSGLKNMGAGWQKVGAEMSVARRNMGVAVADGKLFAVGRCGGGGKNVEYLDLKNMGAGWQKALAEMSVRRVDLGVAVAGGKLFAFGGMDMNYNYLKSVECLRVAY
eukprot:jgi/Bigna1/142789/aug1.73_g17497